MATTTPVQETLRHLDELAGCDPWQSIPRLESIWPPDARITWQEAYEAVCARFSTAEDASALTQRVAFLEGMLVTLRTEKRTPFTRRVS